MEEDDEDRGVKLGLGDFIFYSILVGKESQSLPTFLTWNMQMLNFLKLEIQVTLNLSI